jgi:hypothetical protein
MKDTKEEAKTTKRYRIRCRHEVEIVYEVAGTDFDDALEKLCSVELFTEHSNNLFGPCDYTMEAVGARVVETDSYGDPGPTGRAWQQRDWEYEEEGEGDEWDDE